MDIKLYLKPLVSIVRFLSSRTIILLVPVIALSFGVIDFQKLKLKSLNRVVPSSINDLVEFVLNPDKDQAFILEKYVPFFTTAADVSNSAAAQGMLGYSYYFFGNPAKALKHYQKAIKLNGTFFWFYYNAGVIHYQQGRYKEAAKLFEKAIESKVEDALIFMNTSKIYREIHSQAEDQGYNSQQGLIDGYRMAHELLAKSYFHLKKFESIFVILDNCQRLSLYPSAELFYYSGLVSLAMNDYEQGAGFFQKTIKQDPEFTNAYYYMGLSLDKMGYKDAADQIGWRNIAPPPGFEAFGQKQYDVRAF